MQLWEIEMYSMQKYTNYPKYTLLPFEPVTNLYLQFSPLLFIKIDLYKDPRSSEYEGNSGDSAHLRPSQKPRP